MASVAVTPSTQCVAVLTVSPTEEGVLVDVSTSEEGMASVAVCPSDERLVYIGVSSILEGVWLL